MITACLAYVAFDGLCSVVTALIEDEGRLFDRVGFAAWGSALVTVAVGGMVNLYSVGS